MLKESFVDPFSKQPLLSISTGIAIEQKVSEDILGAFKIGTKSMNTFITDRLSEKSEGTLFDPIKKLKLGTFDTISKKKIIKTKSKIISSQSSKYLFAKVAIIAQKRSVDLKRLLSYPLVHLPLSLTEADGTLKKIAKSLLFKVEGDLEPVEHIKKDHTLIVDMVWHKSDKSKLLI